MLATVKANAEFIDKIKDGGIDGETKSSIRKALDEKKVKDDGTLVGTGRKGHVKFEIKAGGADQAATDIATHTIGMRVPGIGQLPVRRPFLRDLFNTVNTSLEYIKYIDQETVVRDAQNVASAAASTHTTKLTWKERSIQITNIRDLIDVPIDMLQDYDFVEGELRRLLNVNVALRIDTQLMSGTGVHPELHSIGEYASEFNASNTLSGTITPWVGTVQEPNIFDLVIAMASQIIALGQDGSYMPNVVLFNTIDRYKSLLIKDANDNYLMPPFVVRVGGKEYNIDGMLVRSNPGVPANSVWVFDSTKGTIYQRKAAIAEMSFENATNFETEVVTMKVYERLNFLVRNVDKNAFMKCTDVTTALTALATP
jgi:HK97 family phage major capsid protein